MYNIPFIGIGTFKFKRGFFNKQAVSTGFTKQNTENSVKTEYLGIE